MPRRKPARRDPLLVEVLAVLGVVPLVARPLEDEDHPDRMTVLGVCDPAGRGRVTINEAPHLIDTILHECLHRVRPEWTEHGVRRRTTQLLRQLNADEIQRIYEVYVGRVERRKGTQTI